MTFIRTLAAALSLAMAVLWNGGAWAEAGDRDMLASLYSVTILQEICGFEISEAQSDAIGGITDKLEEQLELAEGEAQKFYEDVTQLLENTKPDELCDPKGEAAKAYVAALAMLGK